MNIIMEILFSFNLVVNANSSETKFTNYETAFSNYPTFNKVIQNESVVQKAVTIKLLRKGTLRPDLVLQTGIFI